MHDLYHSFDFDHHAYDREHRRDRPSKRAEVADELFGAMSVESFELDSGLSR
jgi:hypothetical protein